MFLRAWMLLCAIAVAVSTAEAQADKPRARDLGVPFEGTPGPQNAITDVAGVEVGHTTLVSGDAVRTGVTVVLPEGKRGRNQVFAAWFTLNADGEMTGTTWIEESGILEGPVAITNTHSVGTVHQAGIAWPVRNVGGLTWRLPAVAEPWAGRRGGSSWSPRPPSRSCPPSSSEARRGRASAWPGTGASPRTARGTSSSRS